MAPRPVILYCGGSGRQPPDLLVRWAASRGMDVEIHADPGAVEAMLLRGRGTMVFIDDGRASAEVIELVTRIKNDPLTAIVPVTVNAWDHDVRRVEAWYLAGADEILSPIFSPAEQRARLDALQVRTERSIGVHPSTRLPGTIEIDRAIRRQLEAGASFAVCYADLDHFKEFNDRYSYHDGDRVILILSRILHDVVRGILGTGGFVGHIGGDDFILVVPLDRYQEVCTEILAVFDSLVTLQYSEQDRRAGYFFGKDRRGQLHRVPLMTLSIGVVTNRHRRFSHPAEVSELATEMKSYAKSLPGSVFVADRRRDESELRSGPGGADARTS